MENDDWEHASYEAQHRPSCDYCNSMAARLDADSNDREAYLNLQSCPCNDRDEERINSPTEVVVGTDEWYAVVGRNINLD